MHDSNNNPEKQKALNYIDALKILSPREVEVLELVGKGYTRKEIAKQLYISPKTVKRHKENIADKLSLSGYNALLKWLIIKKQL